MPWAVYTQPSRESAYLVADEVAPEIGDTVSGTIMYVGEVRRLWARLPPSPFAFHLDIAGWCFC